MISDRGRLAFFADDVPPRTARMVAKSKSSVGNYWSPMKHCKNWGSWDFFHLQTGVGRLPASFSHQQRVKNGVHMGMLPFLDL